VLVVQNQSQHVGLYDKNVCYEHIYCQDALPGFPVVGPSVVVVVVDVVVFVVALSSVTDDVVVDVVALSGCNVVFVELYDVVFVDSVAVVVISSLGSDVVLDILSAVVVTDVVGVVSVVSSLDCDVVESCLDTEVSVVKLFAVVAVSLPDLAYVVGCDKPCSSIGVGGCVRSVVVSIPGDSFVVCTLLVPSVLDEVVGVFGFENTLFLFVSVVASFGLSVVAFKAVDPVFGFDNDFVVPKTAS